jgi:transposase
MPKRLQIAPHLPVAELERRYRQASEGIERSHYQIIWLLAQEGLHLLFLPPKSPELQPAERLWPLTNEAIANRSFESLDELETLTAHRCRVLMHQRDFVRGVTGYYWWLEVVS